MPEINRKKMLKQLYLLRETLEAELQQKQKVLDSVECLIKAMTGTEGTVERAPLFDAGISNNAQTQSGYEGLSIQRAVEKLLRECPERKFKASETAKELSARGFRTEAKHLMAITASSLNRLTGKGVAEKLSGDGANLYTLKKKPGPAATGSGS